MPDKYTYPHSDVLKNKFNVKDTALLHAYERKYVPIRLAELAEKPIPGNFDFKHLQKIHETLFQDIYTWAGKIREVDIGKPDALDNHLYEFCPTHRIDGLQRDIFNSIRKADYLKGMDKDQFSGKAAEVMGELNLLHPFREGNGRTQREFMRQLAQNAGWELNFEQVTKEQMTEASIAAMKMDYRLLKDIIQESTRPLGISLRPEFQQRIEDIKNAADLSQVKKHQSKEIYDALAKKLLAKHDGHWQDGFDNAIIVKMKKLEISDQKIATALSNSPSLTGLSSIDKGIKTRSMIRDVIKRHPELKVSHGISM